MARALVVYESFWGNTEQVAREVAAGVGEVMPVEVVDVGAAPASLDGVGLLVAGGPTHAFSMTRPSTRRDARDKGAPRGGVDRGLREWLEGLPRVEDVRVATFDTRVGSVRHLPGSAARGAARSARRHGLRQIAPPESFWVRDMGGPLEDGELDRALAWGHDVAAAVGAAV
ncbi:flavodoxin family protein [Oryzobacter sp. R7]|uniref:flavodoxin family protein n=1 Tax=Oryzobacter faecalis TaxID=3388656 RepID=UPI00398D22F0